MAALEDLEQKQNGLSICEAGCYQCLLSYFNQPDHDNINRRNADALSLLVALANAEVVLTAKDQPHQAGAPSIAADAMLEAWLQALDDMGLRRPDATTVPISQGAATAAGQYKAARALVFLQPVEEDISATLADKGWRVLDFSDPSGWPTQFASHPDVFEKPA